MDASCPRYVVADELEWLNLMARMRRTRADAPAVIAATARRAPIEKNEMVRTQRDLIVGKHRIASGSVGTVTALHARRPLVEVAFFVGEPVSVTLAGYELLRASA